MANLNTTNAKRQRISALTSIDKCVQAVTGFATFAEMKASGSTYFPKFYAAPADLFEARAQRRVVNAWNSWAVRNGRIARAFMQPGDWTAHFTRRRLAASAT